MGWLPVLTRAGGTFAGRVAASLLKAIELPELITTTTERYEELAIHLAKKPYELDIIRCKIADNRLTTPLFDIQQFSKHIEAAYSEMYERYQAGFPRAYPRSALPLALGVRLRSAAAG
jgi:protein O-GlcNAc transferase